MEIYYATMFEDIRYERSLIFYLGLSDSHILKRSKFTDKKNSIIKNLAIQKLDRQKIRKTQLAVSLIE